MASSFPGSIDNFTDPLANSSLSSPSHAGQHSDLNDAVEKIETYMGLVKVIPTSATNGTVAANGTVTIGNAVSSVTVTGCYSSLYDHYLVNYQINSQSADGYVRYSQPLSTGSNYYVVGQEMGWTSTTVTGIGPAGTTFCTVGRYVAGLTRVQGQLIVMSPNAAERTWGQFSAPNPAYGYHGQFQIAVNAQDVSFTLAASTGTWTGGTIRVYGYRN